MKVSLLKGLLFLFLLQPPLLANNRLRQNQGTVFSSAPVEATRAELDSLRAQVSLLHDRQMDEYVSILEKTNQQLSLWYNPYGIIIASLAVLFALLAIVASVIIYRQGKDYRQRLDSLVASYRRILDKLVKDWEAKREEIDKKIEGYQSQLASAGDAQKKTIQEEIAKLNAEKESVNSEITSVVEASTPASTVIADLLGFPTNKFHKCSQCGWGFMATVPSSRLKGVTFNTGTVKCPKCGNIDEIHY